jgi:hypothetical protein
MTCPAQKEPGSLFYDWQTTRAGQSETLKLRVFMARAKPRSVRNGSLNQPLQLLFAETLQRRELLRRQYCFQF